MTTKAAERCEVCGRKATWIITVASGAMRKDAGRPYPACDEHARFYLNMGGKTYPAIRVQP